jgi:hypothetical protein
VSTDSRLAAEDIRASAIENEIPSYRAISRLAIVSLLLGLTTILTFASPWFALAGLGAILTGVLATRSIGRYSDLLTGTRLAQAGIALGLVFSLSALTIGLVQGLKVKQSAAAFATQYAEVLKKGDLKNAVWYRLDPAARKTTEPQAFLQEINKDATNPEIAETYIGPVKRLQAAAGPEGEVHFLRMEKYGLDGITPYAFAAFEVHGRNAEGKDEDTHALIELRSPADSATFDWYIKEFVYPYKLESYQLKAKPVDDGHNHAGGGGGGHGPGDGHNH